MENTLYLKSCDYNKIRLQDATKRIIVENGGKLVYQQYKQDHMTFYNRSITEKIEKNNDIIYALKRHNKSAAHLEKENAELEKAFELSKYETLESKYTWGGISLAFALDGYYYTFDMDSNPFFPCYTKKIKLDESNSYVGDYYCESFDGVKSFIYDDIFSISCSDESINNMAVELFNFIINSKLSQEVIERNKKRVPNHYNSGYHYETITKRSSKKTTLVFA